MKIRYLYFVVFLSILILNSCHKRNDDVLIDYDLYSRKIGPEGGELVFFRNYAMDNNREDTLLKMIVPQDALDTTIIVNSYTYFNEVLYRELYVEFDVLQECDFFYLLPFYNFSNANDSINSYKLDNHLSIDFNYPVTFTYYVDTAKYYSPESYYSLYRIKAPRYNEWSNEEIWTEFNKQGYPNGFIDLDLYYLINGKWNSSGGYGTSGYSMTNWEKVSNYTIDTEGHSITFLMDKTDYIYVLVDDSKKKINP